MYAKGIDETGWSQRDEKTQPDEGNLFNRNQRPVVILFRIWHWGLRHGVEVIRCSVRIYLPVRQLPVIWRLYRIGFSVWFSRISIRKRYFWFLLFLLNGCEGKRFILHDRYRADDPIDDGPPPRSWCVRFECHKHQIEIRADSLRNGSGWWLKSISGWVRRKPRRTLTSLSVTI